MHRHSFAPRPEGELPPMGFLGEEAYQFTYGFKPKAADDYSFDVFWDAREPKHERCVVPVRMTYRKAKEYVSNWCASHRYTQDAHYIQIKVVV